MKRAAVVVAIVVTIVIAFLIGMIRHGFSARDEPTGVEKTIARAMRRWSVPADVRARKNPVALTPQVLAEARAHFADHCASCHGNDGKGEAALGAHMYPRTPDMTRGGTQSLSDGELFAIIENGVRLTGMPAFGDGTRESAASSWALVHFIRHLPHVTPDELAVMQKLNPKSAEEWKEMEAEAVFLAGKDKP